MKDVNALSYFDGISCGRVALERAGIPVGKYFAFEIDKFAVKTSEKNYPDIIHLGDINNWKFFDQLPKIDLLLGGFPCQSHSIAGNRKGLSDPRGQLFYVMAEAFEHYKKLNPNLKFLFENVTKIKKQDLEEINRILGCEPIKFNSAVVSAQNRERLYWSNIPFTVPEDRHIYLKDILEDGEGAVKSYGKYIPRTDKSTCLDASYYKGEDNHGQRTIVKTIEHGYIKESHKEMDKYPTLCAQSPSSKHLIQVGSAADISGHDYNKRIYSPDGKSPTLNANSGGNLEPKVALDRVHYRKLTVSECEKLQTLPAGYCSHVSPSQAYKQIGNGWTIDVIVQFFKNL